MDGALENHGPHHRGDGDGAHWPSLLLSGSAYVGGVVSYLLARSPLMRSLLTRVLGINPRPLPLPRLSNTQSLHRLRMALLGRTRREIAESLGAPRIAHFASGKTSAGDDAWWEADTWYYPVPRRGRTAMAITFAKHQAAEIEFIHVPM